MQTKLPMFEGREVRAAALKLTGKSDDAVGALDSGEEVFLIVRGTVEKISHEDAKVGDARLFARVHTVKADRVVLVTADDGERMLEEGLMLSDDRFGVANLFTGPGPDGETGEIPPTS